MAMLEVRGLRKEFGGLIATSDENFHINEREILGLIGPNGAGKTTLFNLLTGFLRPSAGEIRFDGDNLMFGLVVGHEIELGYVSLAELKSVKGPMGLLIERDLYYEPKTLRELKEKHEAERRG